VEVVREIADVPLGYLLAESLEAVDAYGKTVQGVSYIACSYQHADCVCYDPYNNCDDD